MHYEVREAREDDLPYLAANLRSADIREFMAMYGHPRVLEGLRGSFQASQECKVGIAEGNAQVIWGYRKLNHRCGLVWACATNKIKHYRVPFLRGCRPVIENWFEQDPELEYLMNFTHGRNTLHHRWLEWCGADMLPPVPFGNSGDTFRPFVIRRNKRV